MSPTLEMPAAKAPKSKSKFSILLSLIFIITLASFLVWLYSGRIVSKDGVLSGEFIPIAAPMSSTLHEVLVGPNDHVQAGQLIAKLDVGDFLNQLEAAKDLVRGAIITPQDSATRVAEAQKAAEDMVKRIALARHEESIRKNLVEQSSIEHAKAQLIMRDIEAKGGSVAQKESARKAEFSAAQKLQSAKSAFELASQSRSAIESELHKIRDVKQAVRHDLEMASINPSLIYSPISGYLTKNVPLNGQAFALGDTIFQIIPETGAKLYALAKLSAEAAREIPTNTLCFIVPNNSFNIYEGQVATRSVEADTATLGIKLKSTATATGSTINDTTRTVFWVHPLADNLVVKYLLMVLSYIPLP